MAELIIKNASIYTQDENMPRASAVAISQGRIQAVGSDDQALNLAGPETRVIDAEGRMLLPGFCDAHVHYLDWSISLQNLPAHEARSCDDLLDIIAQRAAELPAGEWISGRGLDESNWPQPRLPSLEQLDHAAPGHPLIIYRRDMHMAVANSQALRMAGIGADTADPTEGAIGRDESGRPNGNLMERAMNLVYDRMPAPGHAQRVEIMHKAQAYLHQRGVTGVHDLRVMGGICAQPSFASWQELDSSGRLGLRVWMCLGGDYLDEIISLGLATGFGGERLKTGHVKFFSDGSLGSRTAWVSDAYLDAGFGMQMTPADELEQKVIQATAHGLACSIHAIGDRATQAITKAYANARKAAPHPNPRQPLAPHRMEHVQMIKDEDLARLSRIGGVGQRAAPACGG